MAVFSDTAKRLWGLCLMLTLLVAPDLEYSPLERGGAAVERYFHISLA